MSSVSVITRTKDRPLTLRRVSASLAVQKFRNFDWIIVNDGGARPEVDSIATAAATVGLRARVIHNDRSVGMEAASNIGIAAAAAGYIAILDDDDTWEPAFLDEMTRFLDAKPHYLAAVCQTRIVFEEIEGGVIRPVRTASFNPLLRSVQIIEVLQKSAFTNNSLLFRREDWSRVGGFDESLPVTGDWDFALKLLEIGDIGVVPRPLANYHKRLEEKGASSYGNSIIAGVTIHQEFNAILRNKWLRRDLAAGKTGLGVLFGLGRQFELALTRELNLATAQELLRALIEDGIRETLIFGAGEIGQLLFSLCRDVEIDCPAFLDNNSMLQGTEIDQIPVLAPHLAPTLDCRVITIASKAFVDGISAQLREIHRSRGEEVSIYVLRPAGLME